MWAVIDNEIVIGCIVGVSYEEALQQANGKQLVEMTIENSPAQIGSRWNGINFILPVEESTND